MHVFRLMCELFGGRYTQFRHNFEEKAICCGAILGNLVFVKRVVIEGTFAVYSLQTSGRLVVRVRFAFCSISGDLL